MLNFTVSTFSSWYLKELRLGERLTKITSRFSLALKTCSMCTDTVLISIGEVNVKVWTALGGITDVQEMRGGKHVDEGASMSCGS